MKKFLFSALISLVASFAYAETFNCRVAGFPKFAVEVNDRGNAAFFDSNVWHALRFVASGNGVEDISGADSEYFYSSNRPEISLRFVTYKSKSRNPNGFLRFMNYGKQVVTKIHCKASRELMSNI